LLRLWDRARPGGQGSAVADPTSIYDEIAWPRAGRGRPWVAINMVATVDGKTTLDRGRHPRPIGSRVDRTLMVRLRSRVDAVLRGAGTVRQSPYYPSLPPGAVERRVREGLAPYPLVVVVSGSGDLPLESALFEAPPRRPLILLGPQAPPEAVSRLERGADVRIGPQAEGGLDVRWALACLAQEYGVRVVLSEGGPTLNHAFLRAGCVDELFLTVAPFVAGREDDRTIVDGPTLLEPFPRLELVSAYLHEDELFLRYAVHAQSPDPAGERPDAPDAAAPDTERGPLS